MINSDMVGQGELEVSIGGADVYPRDASWLDDLHGGGVPFVRTRSGNRSDHYPFHEAGVPSLDLFSGMYRRMNSKEDTAVHLDYGKIARIARATARLVLDLSAEDR